MLKIYGRKTSINVMKTLWCCVELGLPFEREDVGGDFGKNQTPDYLAMNPNGLVPTLDDDGFILWESNAIVRYLAGLHGLGGLYPADPRTRAQSDRFMDWQHTVLNAAVTPVFWGLIRTPEDKRDRKAIEAGIVAGNRAFGILDAHLANHPYVAGDTLTMGDIPIGLTVHRWLALPIERAPIPHVEAYYRRLGEREGFRTHGMLPLS